MARARKRKIYRSHCTNPTCRKRFRHADKSALTCSERCRKAVYRARSKAKEETATAKRWNGIFIAVKMKQVEGRHAQRQAVEANQQVATREPEDEIDRHPEPAPPEPRRRRRKRNVGGLGGLNDAPGEKVVIPWPPRPPMTPLPRR